MPHELSPILIAHLELLADSYRRLTGEQLVAPGTAAERAQRIEAAPFVVLSHGTEADPVLNYGNRVARALWEMDWPTFIRTPSRLTAEPENRDKRARILEQVARAGFVTGYSGVRISASGRRFMIEDTVIWNLLTESGEFRGQAAAFRRWRPLRD